MPVICICCAYAQNPVADTTTFKESLKTARALYLSTVKENYALYNGGEYGKKQGDINGFPFFESPGMLKGSVYYKDNWYSDLNLQFDITSEQIVIQDYQKNNLIALQNERIPEFIIDGHSFFRLDNSASLNGNGYYEKLCSGSLTLWVKRIKKMELSAKNEDHTTRFKEFDSYYIQKERTFYSFNNERSLLRLLEKKKTEIKKYISQQDISFKHDFENAALKIVLFYNQVAN